MFGGVVCAVTEAVLVDHFLTNTQVRFSVGSVREAMRLSIFLSVSILLGWAIRKLAQQRAELLIQGLRQRLILADAERKGAEERARASEALRDRDDVLQIALRANGMGLWVWDLEKNCVQWSDEGAGMNPATMQRIFEPFFTTKAETGTGLGLWVVAQLVERHHGRVRVWNTQRPGASATVVSLFLPLGDATATDLSGDAVAPAVA
jgi:K+-sensing histidine kinase KdpD